MFSHVMIGSNDIEASQRFYDALFGMTAQKDGKGRLAYRRGGALFMVTTPIDGTPAIPANGGTIGFHFETPHEIDAWHKAGVKNGGTSIEDAPGYRERGFSKLYLAYLRDPDGNKLCAVHRPAP
jgi:catechol 2,3-dioxygenase-like lactoylglutathione lyase family enzyme